MGKIIAIAGPTAVGKTALSIELAKKINGAIISADSMQVYKYMDIGSAKIMPQEMQGIDHYLIDELLPSDEFNIVRFQQMAEDALQKIYAKGQIPIVAGGTGFYIQALLYDIDFEDTCEDTAYRTQLEDKARELLLIYKKMAKAKHRLLEALIEEPVIDSEIVRSKLNISLSTVKAMEEDKIIIVKTEEYYRNPVSDKKDTNKYLNGIHERDGDYYWK